MSEKELKKRLSVLTSAVVIFIRCIDTLMARPESHDRGKKISLLVNQLDMANDSAMHFALGYSFKKIKEKVK